MQAKVFGVFSGFFFFPVAATVVSKGKNKENKMRYEI